MCGYVVLEYHLLHTKPDTFQTYRLPMQVAHQFVGVVVKSMGNRHSQESGFETERSSARRSVVIGRYIVDISLFIVNFERKIYTIALRDVIALSRRDIYEGLCHVSCE